uniref:Amidase n=2 Tax=Thermorudis TaxID=1649508 RepID=A0A831TAK9_9BACT
MSQAELCYLSAIELRELYRKRALSPVEVTDAILERIERLNPTLTAFITVTADLARRQALEAEQAYAASHDQPLLLGVPLSIKDVTPTRGVRTTRGSLLWKDWIPEADAPVVERLYAAGGVLLGKTNTPELGWKGDSGNRVVGPSHNPWKIGRTAGGSSGGAAAAVAAGLGPLAQGTDGAGSIRIPAAFCGIFGFKPSFGLIPYYPPSAVESLAHMGPMTRTVADAALMLNVMAGPDPRDRNSLNPTGIDYVACLDGDIGGLRACWISRAGDLPVDAEVTRLAEDAARAFSELGCEVEALPEPLDVPYTALDLIWSTAMAAMHRDDLEQVRELVDPGRLAVIEAGLNVRGVDLAWAYAERSAYADRLRHLMERYDILLTPTVPVTAFAAGADHPGEIQGHPTTYLSWTPFTYPFNFSGQPAATVPCGFTSEGLPVGLQIVGRWREDVTVLRAAAAFERYRPWAQLRPPVD